MTSGGTRAGLACFLLFVSYVMGVVQMTRCLLSSHCGVGNRLGLTTLMFLWLPLLSFIVWRMAGVVELFGV